jgi:predicted enzyme related to lactoylglutathione lyase
MNQGVKLLIYPVNDLEKAKEQFGQFLGLKPYTDTPNYVGYLLDGQEIGLDPNGHRIGSGGPVSYWQVDNIQDSLQILLEAGGEIIQDVKDVGGGKLIALVKSVYGNIFGLLQLPK